MKTTGLWRKSTIPKIHACVLPHESIFQKGLDMLRRVNFLNCYGMGRYFGLGETRLVFIPEGIKINGKVYRKVILERHVKQISSTFMKGRNWTF